MGKIFQWLTKNIATQHRATQLVHDAILSKDGELLKALFLPIDKPTTEAGRAGEFLKKQVADPEVAAKAIAEPTIGELPPVVASGEIHLIALYNQLRDANPKVDAEAIEALGKSTYKLEQEMRALGYGSPELLKELIRERVTALEFRMNNRILNAMEEAQNKLDALPVAECEGVESAIIIMDELNKVKVEEWAKVQAKWAEVPKNLSVNFDKTKKIYEAILEDLATAQKEDVPLVLRKSFLAKKGETTTTVKEMQGLRSKLFKEARIARAADRRNKARISDDVADAILEARIARAADRRNKARISDDVADAILDDLGASAEGIITPAGESLRVALAATRHFKERFQQGIVGKILGEQKSGAPTIAPKLTLYNSKGAIDIDKIVVTPEARIATERYLARSFTDYATDKTVVLNITKSRKWIRDNEAILDQLPVLRMQMTDAVQAQILANNTRTLMEARKLRLQNSEISVAAKFLKTKTGEEVGAIFKSFNPVYMANQLVRQARKDATGNALAGLRKGFVDHILEKAFLGYDNLGEIRLSGNALLGFVNKNRPVLRQVFDQEQIIRMEKIGGELAKIEMVERLNQRRIKSGFC